jgi:hypothetical protein
VFTNDVEVGKGEGNKVSDHLDRVRQNERLEGKKTSIVKKKVRWKHLELAYLLEWYYLLRSGVQAGFGGYQNFSWVDLDAFARRFDLEVDTFDAETLRRLDVIWLKSRPRKGDDDERPS